MFDRRQLSGVDEVGDQVLRLHPRADVYVVEAENADDVVIAVDFDEPPLAGRALLKPLHHFRDLVENFALFLQIVVDDGRGDDAVGIGGGKETPSRKGIAVENGAHRRAQLFVGERTGKETAVFDAAVIERVDIRVEQAPVHIRQRQGHLRIKKRKRVGRQFDGVALNKRSCIDILREDDKRNGQEYGHKPDVYVELHAFRSGSLHMQRPP